MHSTTHNELQTWRDQQESQLRADEGWLTLAGLFWLHEGVNTFGSGDDQDLVFPAGSCPAHLGTLTRQGGHVTVQSTDVQLTVNGAGISNQPLQVDGDGKYTPDVIRYAGLSFFVITRGDRVGVRLRDLNSPVRRDFAGRVWYAHDPVYTVEANFTAYESGKTIPILNVLGDITDTPSPGFVTFTLGGQSHTLDAVAAGSGLFFNFRDTTSGQITYGAGRFLMAPGPVDGKTVLDFNRAVSPPCAFTIYATCPIAPLQNHLRIAIPAGEQNHGQAH